MKASERRVKAAWRVDAGRLRYAALAVAILALCVVFHVYRLGQSPGWDPQEGYNLDIAWNLAHGRLRLFALTNDFAQHPPLFYLQLALAIRLLGYDILAVRALAAVYAILTCGALLVVGRRLVGDAAALWGAVVYTVAPVILANTRWGYSYAQLSFVGVLCLGATERAVASYRDGEATRGVRWLLAAAALAGLAAFSDYEGIAWVAFVALVALMLRAPAEGASQPGISHGWESWRPRLRRALTTLAVGLSVPVVGLLICWLIAPGLFVADLGETLGRVSNSGPLVGALSLLLNYYRLVTYDSWLTLGLVGLLFIPHPALPHRGRIAGRDGRRGADIVAPDGPHPALPHRGRESRRGAVADGADVAEHQAGANALPFPYAMGRGWGLGLPLALAMLGLVALATRPIGLSFHTATPLLPLLALGAGLALDAAARILRRQAHGWLNDLTPNPSPTRRGETDATAELTSTNGQPASPHDPPPVGEGRVRAPASNEISPLSANASSHDPPPVGEGRVRAILAALLIFVVVASPLALAAASDLAGLATTLPTRQDAILGTPSDAQAMARYIYAHAHAGDLVLASPEVAWMFDWPDAPAPQTQGADILQTLAQTGQAATFYPAGLPSSRWAYRVALARARYVVVDNLLRQLAAPDQLPALIPIINAAERWPVAFTSGQYTVYARPARSNGSLRRRQAASRRLGYVRAGGRCGRQARRRGFNRWSALSLCAPGR